MTRKEKVRRAKLASNGYSPTAIAWLCRKGHDSSRGMWVWSEYLGYPCYYEGVADELLRLQRIKITASDMGRACRDSRVDMLLGRP